MENGHTLFTENAVQVKIIGRDRSADFAGTVVPNARGTHAEPGVSNVELMPVSPGAALRHVGAFKADVSRTEF